MLPKDKNFRRDKRVTISTRAALIPLSGEGVPIEDASTIDLSDTGVRVRLSGQVEPGQVVDLFLSKHPEPCRVVWTNPGKAKQEQIAGLEFIFALPDVRRRQVPPGSKFEPIN